MRPAAAVVALVVVALVLVGCATTSSDRDLVDRLDTLRTEHQVPGLSYAVVRDWELVDSGGLGVVDLGRGTPATADTRYPIASLTKSMTGVVAVQLATEGLLDLDAALADLTADARFEVGPDDVLEGYAARCADIRAMATHQEPGFDDFRYMFEDYRCDGPSPLTVRHHLTHTAQGEPGSRYLYNGMLFALTTQALEGVTGQSLAELFAERLFEPLGLTETTAGTPEGVAPEVLARSHAVDRETGELAVSPCRECGTFRASSGVVSTARDVARFLIAAETGTDLLGDPARRELLTPPRGPDGAPLPYAHGWFVQVLDDGDEGRAVHWHYGYLPGSHSALFVVLPETGDALVLLAASEGLSAPFGLHEGDVTRSPFARAFLEDRSAGR